MKEWALEHPLLAFTLTSGTVMGILYVFKLAIVAACVGKTIKEEKQDEPAGDNQ